MDPTTEKPNVVGEHQTYPVNLELWGFQKHKVAPFFHRWDDRPTFITSVPWMGFGTYEFATSDIEAERLQVWIRVGDDYLAKAYSSDYDSIRPGFSAVLDLTQSKDAPA